MASRSGAALRDLLHSTPVSEFVPCQRRGRCAGLRAMVSGWEVAVTRLGALAACLLLAACGGGEPAQPAASSAASDPAVQATAAEHAHDAPAASPLAVPPPKVPVLEQELAYGEAQK